MNVKLGSGVGMLLGSGLFLSGGMLESLPEALRFGLTWSGIAIAVAIPLLLYAFVRPEPQAVDPDAVIPRWNASSAAMLYVAGKYQVEQDRLRQILNGEIPDVQSAEIVDEYNRVAAIYQKRIDQIRQGAQ